MDELVWHEIKEDDASTYPPVDKYVLLNFSNFSLPCIGRYDGDEENGFAFYEGDDEKSLASYGLFVNGWMPLPKRMEAE